MADNRATMPRWSRWLIPAVVAGVIIAVVIGGPHLAPLVSTFAHWVDGLGALAPVLFVAGFVVGALLLLPVAVFTMIGGAVFGVLWGTVYVSIAALIAITVAFRISRSLARHAITRRLRERPDLRAVDEAVGRDGFRIVLLLRLTPIFPFAMLNYALGLTRVRTRDYLLASVGSLPATLAFVSAGRLVGDLATVAAGEASPDSRTTMILLFMAVLGTLAVVIVMTRLARKALVEATGVGGP